MNKRPDLNLLIILDAVMRHGSVSDAARELNLSQPAVSHALGRLRDRTGDRLFLRAGGRLVPTVRAIAMAGPAREVLERAQALLTPERFDPQTSTHSFRLGASDYALLAVVPLLMTALRREAPGIRLRVRDAGTETLAELGGGGLDAGLWLGASPGENWRLVPLFQDHVVGLCAADHPFAGAPAVDLLEWSAQDHLSVGVAAVRSNPVDDALARCGLRRRVTVHVPSFSGGMAVLPAGRQVMVLPERLLPMAARLGLASFPLPVSISAFPYGLLRHARTFGDSGLDWLETLLCNVFHPA